jgi:hypothetical protein
MTERERRPVKTRAPQTFQVPSTSTSAPTAPLSPACAFVVQFRERATGAGEQFAGRVEHMVTGHAARFESSGELLAFFVRILSAVQTQRSEEA